MKIFGRLKDREVKSNLIIKQKTQNQTFSLMDDNYQD